MQTSVSQKMRDFISFLLIIALLCTGTGWAAGQTTDAASPAPADTSAAAAGAVDMSSARFASLANDKKMTFSKKGTTIDYGNSSEGYIMVMQKAQKKAVKLQITKGKNKYLYDLNNKGNFEVFPLQFGDGKYQVQLYSQVSGNKYSPISNTTISVKLSDPNVSFLYPNQYAMYDQNSTTVAKSFELCQGLTTDQDKVDTVFNFISKNFKYDYVLAMKVQSGYLPDIDAKLASLTGICFDYSAVMACMLRVQGIPTQLAIGHADTAYHAWNLVFLDGQWVRYDSTFASTGATANKYTVERFY